MFLQDLPREPTALTAAWDPNTGAIATWTAPTDRGGAEQVAYGVYVDNSYVTSTVSETVALGTLSPGNHIVEVVTSNTAGESPTPATTSVYVPPVPVDTVPGVPTGLVATRKGPGHVLITWSPPAISGGRAVTSYRVQIDGVLLFETTGRIAQLTSLAGGPHTISVSARNSVGIGTAAQTYLSFPAPPDTPPGQARIGWPQPGRLGGPLTVMIAWTAPTSTGGAPIIGYQVSATRVAGAGRRPRPVIANAPAQARRVELTLKRGTWVIRIRARNAEGWGPWSTRSAKVKPG